MNGKYCFNVDRLDTARYDCQRRFKAAVDNGIKLIIVSNTFLQLLELEPYLDEAMSVNAKIEVYELYTENRNIHDIPEEVVQAQRDSFEPFVANLESSVTVHRVRSAIPPVSPPVVR